MGAPSGTPGEDGTGPRSVLLGVVVGAAVALCATAIVFAIIAIPLYTLARADPGSGLDRPFIRDGLTRVAIPAGLVLGTLVGAAVGVWYRRGGRLPLE